MRKYAFLPIIMLIISSCINKSATNKGQSYEDSIRQMINKQFHRDSLAKSPKMTPEDSLMRIIYEQYQKDNVITKYYNISKNTKKIVRSGFGFLTIPDSIAHIKKFYKNGSLCGEGSITFFDSRDGEGSCEVGKWKYCTPDGTKFEKYYKYTIGIQKDSI